MIWLRNLHPWSPDNLERPATTSVIMLKNGDITEQIGALPTPQSMQYCTTHPDSVSQANSISNGFTINWLGYLKCKFKMFHYTGSSNEP